MMTAANKYGVLPYSAFGSVISDKAMVQLGWNKRTVFPQVYDKYGPVAEKFQIVTTVPKEFNDLLILCKAGYVTGYGTDLAVRKNSSGIYRLTGGGTAHSMTVGGLYKEGYLGHANSYSDGCGWIPIEDHRKQFERRHYSCFTIIDIERIEFNNVKPDLTQLKTNGSGQVGNKQV
jgi:hypothetical protein